jgi:hypothetical protein
LDGLEDFNLDTGLSLVLLGGVGSNDSLGVGKTSSNGLVYFDRCVDGVLRLRSIVE